MHRERVAFCSFEGKMPQMIDVTDQDFNEQVVEKSHEVPVVVDLWAPWCGPCKTLGPILDSVIGEHDGKVVGVKINVDENPAVSQAFQVQSIPMVVAFKDGQAVDGFMGAQGEPMVRDFVSKLLPTEEENQVDALVAAGDEVSLRAALDLDNDHEGAIVALAELLVGDERAEEGLALLQRIPETAETRRVAALARTGGDTHCVTTSTDLLSQLLLFNQTVFWLWAANTSQ